ncbi:hypothetical protein LZK73_24920 (plasmid) [Neorhizobium galegae]|nr:hypothetical protein LZK73_24920 [Neorhizobium galegae]
MNQWLRGLDAAALLETRKSVFAITDVLEEADVAILGTVKDIFATVTIPIDDAGEMDALFESPEPCRRQCGSGWSARRFRLRAVGQYAGYSRTRLR